MTRILLLRMRIAFFISHDRTGFERQESNTAPEDIPLNEDNHYWKILTSEVKNNIKTRDTVWKSILVTCAGLGQFQLPAENSIATAADCSNHCPLSTVLELPSLICNDHDCLIIYF